MCTEHIPLRKCPRTYRLHQAAKRWQTACQSGTPRPRSTRGSRILPRGTSATGMAGLNPDPNPDLSTPLWERPRFGRRTRSCTNMAGCTTPSFLAPAAGQNSAPPRCLPKTASPSLLLSARLGQSEFSRGWSSQPNLNVVNEQYLTIAHPKNFVEKFYI